MQVKAIDFSLNGLSLECSRKLPIGATCQVLYSHPSRGLCWVEGIILYCTPTEPGFHVGLQLQFRSLADRLPYQQIVLALDKADN